MRTPRWLGPPRVAVLAAIVIAGAGGILAYDRYLVRTVESRLMDALTASTGVRATLVRSWVDARRSEAELLSTLLGAKPGSMRSSRDADTVLLQAVVTQGRFDAGWVVDRTGAVLAKRARATDSRDINDRRVVVRLSPIPSDTPTMRVELVSGGRAVVDFSVPVRIADSVLGWVVLRASPGVSELPFMGVLPVSVSNETEHSTLLAPIGDRAIVLASASHAPPDSAQRTPTLDKLPAWVNATLKNGQQKGEDDGLAGARVFYGATAVPRLGWIVVRDVETAEVTRALSKALWINNSIFSLIVVLMVVAVAAVWRTSYLRRASEVVQLRSEFVSSVSHELRTPLTQIRMYAEMLRGGLLPDRADTNRALRVIEKESERLAMLVDKTLSFVRPVRSTMTDDPPPIDVAGGIREALIAFAPLAAERGAQLLTEVVDQPQASIERSALQQILLNLLENAVKYGPRGQTIRVGARESSGTTQIWVEDEGPGVAPAERETIWRAFQRGRAAEERDATGSGIGLAVVREMATQYGGTAHVEAATSERRAGAGRGVGARFVILLPASSPSAAHRNGTSARNYL
jgi:signal transduction histidine kinase